MTGDLAVWLRAQLDADEQVARAATPGPWQVVFDDTVMTLRDERADEDGIAFDVRNNDHDAEHIALHDPAFTLADITAKRAIIDLHQTIAAAYPGATVETQPCCAICSAGGEYPGQFPCATLRLLAQPYAGRPGWHNEWTTT